MFKEGLLDKILRSGKKLIPRLVFNFFAPMYYTILAYVGAVVYGFPSRSMKVIGVTGTKGKSTTVYLITKILEHKPSNVEGHPLQGGVAAIGSLGFKIKDREWPNTLKMTMPGRFKLQKFMAEARNAGCEYVVLEVTSEGIKQKRHLGIKFDCAVFTNLHKEHIESHGSFENYYKAKQELFAVTKNMHVLNSDDSNLKLFSGFSAKRKIFYGLETGDMRASNLKVGIEGTYFKVYPVRSLACDKSASPTEFLDRLQSSPGVDDAPLREKHGQETTLRKDLGEATSNEVYGTSFSIELAGRFNVLNCLAALSVGAMYGIDLPKMKPVLESIKFIPGRMEFLQRKPFGVVVDYAHTPESLEAVYKTLKSEAKNLICVLGAAGGGRDKWKRHEFGRIAAKYCDEIILTNEDPYDENPLSILKEIESGFSKLKTQNSKLKTILDRREAIRTALTSAQEGDMVITTGKGSETSMAVAGGKKLPWSDRDVIREVLKQQGGPS